MSFGGHKRGDRHEGLAICDRLELRASHFRNEGNPIDCKTETQKHAEIRNVQKYKQTRMSLVPARDANADACAQTTVGNTSIQTARAPGRNEDQAPNNAAGNACLFPSSSRVLQLRPNTFRNEEMVETKAQKTLAHNPQKHLDRQHVDSHDSLLPSPESFVCVLAARLLYSHSSSNSIPPSLPLRLRSSLNR